MATPQTKPSLHDTARALGLCIMRAEMELNKSKADTVGLDVKQRLEQILRRARYGDLSGELYNIIHTCVTP
jgi:hypothetical protein